MIEKVLVTIQCPEKEFSVDAELPANVTVDSLLDGLLSLLKEQYPDRFGSTSELLLYIDKRRISSDETLSSIGAWDGSVLTVKKWR